MKFLIVIPARYGSTRFEGKPLIDIHGKSLIQRTFEQALKARVDATVVVATDDERIAHHVSEFGQALMTSEFHVSGTDRCFEVYEKIGKNFDVLINLQGDEPFIRPQQIEDIAKCMEDKQNKISSLCKKIESREELFNPNTVKVIPDKNLNALYFSRQAIPYFRGQDEDQWHLRHDYYRHVGIYAFQTIEISQIRNLPLGKMEKAESLVQLRWLEAGYKIKLIETEFMSPAIDTTEELHVVENFLKSNPTLI